MPLPPAARGVPLPFPPLPFRDSLRPLLELPLPLPADLGELDLLAPVLCAFPLELELELELGCAESRRSSPASADGRLGRLPGIFGRLGVNFDVEFAPGAAHTCGALQPRAGARPQNGDPRAGGNRSRASNALLDADGEAEENDAPTALRSAAAASGAQSRAPTVTHSSAGSSLARRGSSRSAWGWWRGYGCWYLFSIPQDIPMDRPGAGPEVARPAVHPSLASIGLNNSGGTDGPLRRPRGVSEVPRRRWRLWRHRRRWRAEAWHKQSKPRVWTRSQHRLALRRQVPALEPPDRGARPGVPPARIRSRSRRPPSARWCPTTQPVDECFAPLSTYARRVEEVREELQRTRAIEVQRVVLTSDETNATWEEVAAYGWHRVDHSTTAVRPREGGAKEVGGGEQRRAKPRLGYSERIMVPFELHGVPRRPKAGGRRRATSGVVEAEAARCGAALHVVGARQC
ncbi:hypothetical protein B0H14DRAFT_3132958 [Mycena olivaceomarginata]|nr:hypothetical protein B0H14DRAFT_3132958 [Mycena olivaceomarginata]